MKQLLLLSVIPLLVLIFSYKDMNARGLKIPVGSFEKVHITVDLPNIDDYKMEDGNYVDIGVAYTVFSFAWLSVYTEKSPELIFVAVSPSGEHVSAFDAKEEEIRKILAKNNIQKNNLYSMPFMDKWGGKLIVFAFFSLIIWGMMPSSSGRSNSEQVVPKRL